MRVAMSPLAKTVNTQVNGKDISTRVSEQGVCKPCLFFLSIIFNERSKTLKSQAIPATQQTPDPVSKYSHDTQNNRSVSIWGGFQITE
jgi:hypothetical protein